MKKSKIKRQIAMLYPIAVVVFIILVILIFYYLYQHV